MPVVAKAAVPARGLQPALVEPTVGPEAVAADLTTTVTTSDDELISFVERTTGETFPPSSDWRDAPAPRTGSQTTRIGFASHAWTCLARRTSTDERAIVVRNTKRGLPIVPIAWMAKTVQLRGVPEAEARAWYQAMSQRVATAGRATGLTRFTNGNALAVLFELVVREDVADIELVAKTELLKPVSTARRRGDQRCRARAT